MQKSKILAEVKFFANFFNFLTALHLEAIKVTIFFFFKFETS